MHREHAVLVARELGELVHVVPHALVRRVEEVRAVAVHLDACLGLRLGVGVSTDVVTTIQHQYPLVQLGGGALGDRQTEESGTDDNEVITCEAHPQEGSREGRHGPRDPLGSGEGRGQPGRP